MTTWRALRGLGCFGLIASLFAVRPDTPAPPAIVVLGDARFSEGVARVGSVAIGLAAMGRASLVALDVDAEAAQAGDEVHFVRAPGVVEWWRSLSAGMEQGVTIDARPPGEGPLVLEMSVGDGIVAEGEGTITLRDANGDARATYSALSVLDRDGQLVPSRMVALADHIRIEVDDADAAYPLIVDPLVITEEAAPTHAVSANSDLFGSAVGISADGVTAVVGAVGDDSVTGDDRGSVQLYRWSGAAWTAAGIAYGGGGSGGRYMGLRVDVAADGTRAIAMSRDNLLTVFRIEAGGFVVEHTVVSPCRTGFSTDRHDGPDVAISDDGARIVLGHHGSGGADGCAYVFARTGTAWAQEAGFRVPASAFGRSVAISGDGSRVAITAPDGGALGPRVEVYSRAGSTWSAEATVPVTAGPTNIAFDATGTRFVVAGSGGASVGAGVYVRSGTAWSREGSLAQTADEVAIDAGGNRVVVLPSGGGLSVYRRSGSTWSLAGSHASFGGLAEAVALAETGRILVGFPGDDSGGIDRGLVRSYTTGLGVGDACVVNGDCTSAACVDGFCCATACGGGATDDCQACSAALTGGTNGTCAALSPSVAPTITCRAVASACDRAEVCSSASIDCPANTPMPGGTVCGPSRGPCDREELCDGTSFVCASDSYLPAGTTCGGGGGECVTAGVCTGSSVLCAGGTPLPSTTVCLPAAAGNPCDLDDHCDGEIGVCVPTYAPVTMTCGGEPTGLCDAPNYCSGTSADCEEVVLAGIVCRPSIGGCDAPEVCVGDSPNCPEDSVVAAGISCRTSTMSCDPAEVCDGASAMCPADVTCDAGSPDVGVTGAEPPPTPAAGCACRASARTAGTWSPLWLLALAAWRWARRRPAA